MDEGEESRPASSLGRTLRKIFMRSGERDTQRVIQLLGSHYKGKVVGLNHFEGTVCFYDRDGRGKEITLLTRVFCSNDRTLPPISPINTEGNAYQEFFENHWHVGVENIPQFDPSGHDFYPATYHEILVHYKQHPDVPITLIHAHGFTKGYSHYLVTDLGVRKTDEIITELIQPYASKYLGYKSIVILASCNAVDPSGRNPVTISHPDAFIVYTHGMAGVFGSGDLRIST